MVFLVVLNVIILRTEAELEEEIPSSIHKVHRRDVTDKSSDVILLLNKLTSDMKDMKAHILNKLSEQLEKQSKEMKKMADNIKNAKELITEHVSQTDSSIANLSDNVYVLMESQDGRWKEMKTMTTDLKKFNDVKELVNGLQSSQELIISQLNKTEASIAALSEAMDVLKKTQRNQAKDLDDIKEGVTTNANLTAKMSENLNGLKDGCIKQEDETKNNQKHLTTTETSLAYVTDQISRSLRFPDQRLQNSSSESKSLQQIKVFSDLGIKHLPFN